MEDLHKQKPRSEEKDQKSLRKYVWCERRTEQKLVGAQLTRCESFFFLRAYVCVLWKEKTVSVVFVR